MDIDIEDAPPGIDIILNREFRLRNTSEAEQDVDAVELLRHICHGLIDSLFNRDIHLFEKDTQPVLTTTAGAIEVLHSLRTHLLVHVENGHLLDPML